MKKNLISLMAVLLVVTLALTSCMLDNSELIADLESQIEDLKGELEEAKKELAEKDQEIGKLKEENSAKDKEADALKGAIKKLQDEIAALESKDAENLAEIEKLKADYAAKVAELEEAKKANEEALANLEAEHKAEIDGLNGNIAELETAYNNKVAELEEAKKANEEALANLEAEHKAEVEGLGGDIAELEKAYEAKVAELEAEKKANAEALAKLNAEHKTAIEALNTENANLALQIEALEARIKELLKDKDYIVTFDVNGGEGTVEDQTIRYNMTVKKPTTPTKEGYDFVGWYVNGEKAEFPYVVTGNTEFVAEYVLTKYTITYEVNGGTMPESYVNEYNVETGVTLPTPTRSLYLFDGWYEDAKFEGAKVTSISVGEFGNKTYYAKWLSTTDGITYKLANNDTTYTVTGYDGKDTVVVIPSSIDGIPVTAIAQNAFKDKQRITSITVPDSVTSIGTYAFSGCIGLTELNLGNGIKTIPNFMAYGCNKLQSIVIPDSVTSIGSSAFRECSSLVSVVIGDSVTSIDYYAFYRCDSLVSIVIGDSVTSIGSYAFDDCDSLANVYINDLSNWCKISFSNSYSNPLYCADNLYVNGELVTELVIPDDVTTIKNVAFYDLDCITSVVIPDSVTSIGQYAFYNCTGLVSVVIPDSVTSIRDYAFYDCNSLVSVVIPDSVTSIGSSAFYNCTSLVSVVIGDSVTTIGSYAFRYCSNLYVVYNNSDLFFEIGSTNNGYLAYNAKVLVDNGEMISANDGYNYTLTDDGFLFREKDSKYELISYIGGEDTVTLPEDINGNPYDLYYMSGVVNVIIPEGFTTINDYAFYGCCSLTSVVIPDSVTSIGSSAFWGCTNLASVVIPDSITFIGGGAFNECYNLTSVVIGNGVTSIGEWAFRYCTNFTSVYYNGSAVDWNRISISSNSNDYLTNAARYYYSETEPTTSGNYWHWVDGEVVVWPAHVHTEEILPAVSATCTDGLTQGKKCSVCGEILVEQEVILAEHNYENRICTLCGGVQGSDGLAFSSNGDGTCSVVGIGTCTDTEIIIPKTSPDGDMVVSIGENAFFLCYNLTSVVIPNTVTKIGKLAFVLCENLTSVTIPASVSYIDEFAFSACINLISIEVDENNQHYCSIDGNLYSKDGKTLIKYASGKKDTSFEVSNNVIVIDAWAFDNCNSLVNVVISSSVTTIGYSPFAHCTSLTNITVDMNNQHYMSIDGNLYSKDGKELIQYAIGKTNTHFEIPSHVTSIWTEAFQNCDDLISVVIPNSVTSIGENAFSRCYSLTSVEFKDPNGWVIDGSYLLTSSELSNTSTAAQYLTSTCRYYIWSKQ